jgi:hypothetical protein
VTTHNFVFSFFPRRETNAFDLDDDDDAEKEEPLRAENAFAKTNDVDAIIYALARFRVRVKSSGK